MIHLKKALSVLAVSLLFSLASCAPNNEFTLIYAYDEPQYKLILEINKDTSDLKIETLTYKSINSCLRVVEYDALPGFDGPVFEYQFFFEGSLSQTRYLLIYHLPNNTEPFQDSNLKTTNWYFSLYS
jgi:hypothetical protein